MEEGQETTDQGGIISAEPTAAVSILGAERQEQLDKILERDDAAPELLDLIIDYAIEQGASDVLFEPQPEEGLIRVRIDGILQVATRVPSDLFLNSVSRLKVMAGLDITQHNSSQEGKIVFERPETQIDARTAVASTTSGEMVVLRLHDRRSTQFTLQDIGLKGKEEKDYRNLLASHAGLILICGPTGSGKTSTLYSSLHTLNSEHKNIVSVEDPIEYIIPGLNQMQVDVEHGVTFAEGLKIILRLNPDVVFVGEIRDAETAHIAVEASLTGHLVLSTIHANSAVSSISRLVDLGIDKFFINNALIGSISQRLVRRGCTVCGRMMEPSPEEGEMFFRITGRRLEKQMIGPGCEACAMTGYKGRMPIIEVMTVDEQVRALVTRGATERQITQQLVQNGYHTLLQDGMNKVEQGLTTVREVIANAFITN
ncbi:MAG TPA: GspE/PulE family protein [Verrucomicrobiae bacterium]|nr:GspE/PulE family protein [Verrucomicrobiae bacterium]